MSFKALLDRWRLTPPPEMSEERYSIHLPSEDAARIEALGELFPGTAVEQIISDLLHTGLDEVEASMPYVPGDKVILEDEFGDPIYEDVGMTPKFLDLVRNHRKQLDKD